MRLIRFADKVGFRPQPAAAVTAGSSSGLISVVIVCMTILAVCALVYFAIRCYFDERRWRASALMCKCLPPAAGSFAECGNACRYVEVCLCVFFTIAIFCFIFWCYGSILVVVGSCINAISFFDLFLFLRLCCHVASTAKGVQRAVAGWGHFNGAAGRSSRFQLPDNIRRSHVGNEADGRSF